MTCAHCGSDNPAGKKFCGDCGAALENRCPQCGADNPANKKFCGDCGASLSERATPPLAPAPSAPPELAPAAPGPAEVGERRQLSVLFCDLVGTTPLSQQLDAEEWRDLIAQYQRAASGAVVRFGGHLAKNLGDGLLIYFGWPTAREDDPERAVRAGLAIVDEMAPLNAQFAAWAEKGIALAQGDVKLGAHVFGYSPALNLMVARIAVLAEFGQHEPWGTAYEQVEQLALEHDEVEMVALAAHFRCETRILYGDPAAACRDGARAAEMAEQLGSPFWIAYAATNLAWACAEAAAFEDALATAERGLAAVRGKNAGLEIILLARLAEARAGTGDSRGACDAAREALALYRRFPEMRDAGVRAA